MGMKQQEDIKVMGEGLFIFFKWLLFSLVIGLIVGTVGVAFHYCIQWATVTRTERPYLLYFLPIGGLAITCLYRVCGMQAHAGTNLVLRAVRENEKLTLMTAPLIFISTVITHLFGGSSGREGAALQLGGSISNKIGRMIHLDEKDERIITMCGMSAAFSALFGTPVTAIFFSMEVVSVGVMYYSAIVPCAVASLVGHGVAIFFNIAPTRYMVKGIPNLSVLSGLKVLLLGVCCAFVSVLFCIAMEKTAQLYKQKIKNDMIRVFVGGLIIIGLTLISGTCDYNGAGMDVIQKAIGGEAAPEAFLMKILFTALTLGAGFKGGEIVPVIFTGATFGNVAGKAIGLDPSFGAAIGVTALFCGVTNCPLTAVLLGIEVFGDGMVYFALACAVSYLLSGYFGLYGEQKIVYSKYRPEFINQNTK